MGDLIIRRGEPADVEPAVAVWLAANSARRKGLTPGAEQAARARGQLWTQSDNMRARRLYEGRGFVPSGREKYEFGERIVHYQRALRETV